MENVVDPWIANLWPALSNVCQQKETGSDGAADLAKAVSEIEISPMTQAEIVAQEPFSMEKRRQTLSDIVKPYTELPNSLVQKDQAEDQKAPVAPGHKIHIDTSALASATQLTGLPRIPGAYIKLSKVENGAEKPQSGSVPHFVYTPNPVIDAAVSKVSCISRVGALKRTLHLELDLGSQTDFQPGDAFGVIAPNDEDLVQAILKRLGVQTTDEEMQMYSVQGEGTVDDEMRDMYRWFGKVSEASCS